MYARHEDTATSKRKTMLAGKCVSDDSFGIQHGKNRSITGGRFVGGHQSRPLGFTPLASGSYPIDHCSIVSYQQSTTGCLEYVLTSHVGGRSFHPETSSNGKFDPQMIDCGVQISVVWCRFGMHLFLFPAISRPISNRCFSGSHLV